MNRKQSRPLTEGEVKLGRPSSTDEGGELQKITFRLDRETLRALEALEADIGGKIRGRRSIVLRRLIINAATKTSSFEK